MGFGFSFDRHGPALASLLGIGGLIFQGALATTVHEVPLFMSASDMARQGFVRIINRSNESGTVRIRAIDDAGKRFGPVDLTLDAQEVVHFNSNDLELGSEAKGLSAIGSGTGNWRLEIETELDIESLAYIRTPADGFLTSMHDVVQSESTRWYVPIFNPGSNRNQESHLRLINVSGIDTEIVIEGRDDRGELAPGGEVRVMIPGDAARTLSAEELENGYSASESDFEFDGRLGNGSGKWQLFVSAGRPIMVMSLMSTPTGHLANLSSVMGENVIRGSAGDDVLFGGNGNDILDPMDNDDGTDIVHGSTGHDRIIYTESGPTAYQELRYSDPETGDHLSGSGITVTIEGAANRASVEKGTEGMDTVVDIVNPLSAAWNPPRGGFGLYGTSSDDIFHLNLGDEQWMQVGGGAGDDTYNILGSYFVRLDYRDATNGIDVDLRTGRVADDGFGDTDTSNGPIRGIAGSEFSDVIRGTDRRETFVGRGGSDEIEGGGGEDSLRFDFEDEVIENLVVDAVTGMVTGTWNGSSFSYTISGIETFYGSPGDDIFKGGNVDESTDDPGGADDFRVKGSAGDDRFEYSDRSGTRRSRYHAIDYDEDSLEALLNSDGVTITIDGVANRASVDKGTVGTDTIVDIADALSPGSGGVGIDGTQFDDVYNLSFAADQWMQIDARAGNDTFNIRSGTLGRISFSWWQARNGIEIDLAAGKVLNDGHGDVDTINGTIRQVRGTDFADVFRGSDNDESFIGRGGDDTVHGGGGHDQLRFDRYCCGRFGDLNVDLEAGTVTGTWEGSAFTYTVSGIEEVRGGPGDDTFVGTSADETFQGREGTDTFVFGPGHGADRIRDFVDGEDIFIVRGLGISKSDVLGAASPYSTGVGVWIDLTPFGGGTLSISGLPYGSFDASDFLL